jgi:hypothetical protein
MKVAAFAAGLFAVAFLLHLLCWRIRRPSRVALALLSLFLGTLVLGLLAALYVPWLGQLTPLGPWEVAHVCLFHVAASLAYIVLYSALEQDSPTLTIIAFVAAAERGRSRNELFGLVRDDHIVGTRFDALVASQIIAPAEGTDQVYVLTSRGQRWARLFGFCRHLYRLDKGG